MMNYYEKFGNDLKKGEGGEETIADYFRKKGYKVKPNFKKNSDFDLELLKDDKTILLEVKTDEYYLKKELIIWFLRLVVMINHQVLILLKLIIMFITFQKRIWHIWQEYQQ